MLAKKKQSKSDLKQSFLAEGGYGAINESEYDFDKSQTQHYSEQPLPADNEFPGLAQFNVEEETKRTFRDLSERHRIPSRDLDIINIGITYGSKYCVAIARDSQSAGTVDHFEVIGYSLNSFQQKWARVVEGKYIKMKEIEQSDDGNTLAVCYQDDGVFRVLILRANGELIEDVNVSKILHLDKRSKGIEGFWEPLITCAFVPGNLQNPKAGSNIMICAYHRFEQKQYHFNYSIEEKKMIGQATVGEIKDCTYLNFPIKSFYSAVFNNCYTFYRQGHAFTMDAQDPKNCHCETITDADLGSMYLLFDQALIVRSSSSVLFFKLDPETNRWAEYFRIRKMRGNIFFIKGNVRFQITTDDKVYFYLIDKETLLPQLENVMYNFMNCSQMMFGSLVRYCITFKTNQPNFSIWVRKSFHNFKVALTNENMEGSIGANLRTLNQYVMTERKIEETTAGLKEKQVITVHDNETYTTLQEWAVPTREEGIEILYLAVSKDDQKIGVALGKRLIKNRQHLSEIAVYNRQRNGDKEEFALEALKEFPYHEACMRFEFNAKNNDQLIFFQHDKVFMIDITDESVNQTLYRFKEPLVDQPTFGAFNRAQDKFIVTSTADVRYCDLKKPDAELDLDDELDISAIESITVDDEHFYVLANKRHQKLGFYLFQVNQKTPRNVKDKHGRVVAQNIKCLISWNNKLDVGNSEMAIMEERVTGPNGPETRTSLVVSYKMIGINTFNVFCFDLNQDYLIKYWYEGYQLWESPIRGFLLANNDFLMLSKDGINLIALGAKPNKTVLDKDKQKRLMHSLGSCDYLKIESTNHLLFACQYYDDRQICLQEQYNDTEGDTHFDDIFKIKIFEITLRELLLLQSIYNCKTQGDIELLVKDQPDPKIFFKVFLELGIKSLVPYLAFDARSMRSLLAEENREYFNDEFPLFYKNEKGRSAIDTALENNQIRSVNLMVDYIVQYQNSLYYAHLFNYNAVELLNKGVTMQKLFASKIFNHTFDYDEWPSTNNDTTKMLAPFNESMFRLRHHYKDVFPRLHKRDEKKKKKLAGKAAMEKVAGDLLHGAHHAEKVYKIKYQLNILTSVSEEDGPLMDAVANSDELAIFETDMVRDMIDYKWRTYARRQHLCGGFVHLVYVLVLIAYISRTFLEMQAIQPDFVPMHAVKKDGTDVRARQAVTHMAEEGDEEADVRIFPPCDPRYMIAIAACLLYPALYDGTQLFKQGASYFAQGSNYIDVCHVLFGYYNIWCQMADNGTWNIWSKIVMIICISTCLLKTFFFMRIFTSFSYIVTMITNVVIDLKIFLIFFAILIIMFSMIFDVITRNEAPEYAKIGFFWGNVFTTLRLALGDFDFGMIEDKTLTKQHVLFWVTWLIMVIFSSLIFLNFIIAEVSSSYNNVKQNINALIYKERAALITEAEDITSQSTKKKNKKQYPKFIVIREQED